jgi:hypothetical protein
VGRERIDLLQVYGSTIRAEWRYGAIGTWHEMWLRVGQLPDGRWWLDASRNPRGALICADEADAYGLAQTWMTKSGLPWTAVPVR